MTEQHESFFTWLAAPNGGRCVAAKPISDDLYAGIKPLLFHWTLIVGEIGDREACLDRWCYADQVKAAVALAAWDGTGEPEGWHRHPATGRCHEGGDPGKEYVVP